MTISSPDGHGRSLRGWHTWLTDRGRSGVLTLDDPHAFPPGLRGACEPAGFDWAMRGKSGNYLRASRTGLCLALDGDLVSEVFDGPGRISRRIDTALRVANHDRFFLPEGAGGQGRGRTMLGLSVDLYGALGIERVELRAEQIGKYAWAALGFEFAHADERHKVNEAVRRFARDELGAWHDPPDFEEPWHLPLLYDGTAADPVLIEADLINQALEARYQQNMFSPPRVEGRILASKALLLYADYDHWEGVLRLDETNGGFRHFCGTL